MATDWEVENLKGAIALADSAIRSLILVNGVAGISLLTFYGNHGNLLPLAKSAMHGSLMSFGIGVFSAVICALFAYFSQRTAATIKCDRLELIFASLGVIFALVSAGEFANGLYLGSCALS
jgi:hypothetical protein